MHQFMIVALAAGLVGGAVIHVGPAAPVVVPGTVVAETSLVVPAGSRVLTRLTQALSVRATRPGDTIYLRVTAPLAVGGRMVISTGSYVEGIVSNVLERASPGRVELGLRVRRLLSAQGDIADIFAAAPNDGANRRGVVAVADLPGRDQVVTMVSTVALVVESAFTVDTRRSLATALGHRVRVIGSPPRVECLVESAAPTPDVRIPGTPPTPAIGDLPGTPGTPDIVIPGAPNATELWQPCR